MLTSLELRDRITFDRSMTLVNYIMVYLKVVSVLQEVVQFIQPPPFRFTSRPFKFNVPKKNVDLVIL